MKYFDNNLLVMRKNILHVQTCMWVFLIAISFAVTDVFAAVEPAGSVVFVNGRVTATSSAHGERALSKSDPIFNTDRIDTADNGRGQFRFSDGGLVSLMPNTTFSVEEYFFEDESSQDSAVFGLLKGGLRTITGSIGKVDHEEYELKTPVATLGIRGTEYVAVIQPANTLRVHVGRGKVVITNDHGTLEVPEGRNAVVSLGGAPEFSEKGPVFVATAPTGDRLVASMMPTQDPDLLVPDTDSIIPDYVTFTGPNGSPSIPANSGIFESGPLASSSGSGGSSGGNTGGGNNSGGGNSGGGNPPPPPPNPMTMMVAGGYIEEMPNWTGRTYVLHSNDLDLTNATPQPCNNCSNDYLEWGEYGDDVVLNGNNINFNDSRFTYVRGQAVENYMPSGQLNYSLVGDVSSGGFNLSKFDLGLDLGNSTYTLDFALGIFTSNTSGGLNAGSVSQNFGFSTSDIIKGSGPCTACNLDVEGFLAGQNGEAAGVGYSLHDGSASSSEIDTFTGSAALDKQSGGYVP